MKERYDFEPRNILPNGLTLLQVNPDCAAQLQATARDFGWLYIRWPEGNWITHRKLEPLEIEQVQDQAADMRVLHGTKVRCG